MTNLGPRLLRGAALALLPLTVLAAPAPGVAGAVPTCHGQEATLVGAPGERLVGTSGDDVIVTNEASVVRGGDGDDLICVTGDSGHAAIWDGPGDDVVDAHRFTGFQPEIALGAGSDRYLGSPGKDVVIVDGRAGDRDRVRTGDGRDHVAVESRSRGHIDADLGAGNDRIDLYAGVTFDLAGGPGRDLVDHHSCECGTVEVRLGLGTWVDDRQRADIPGFENAAIVADRVELHGSKRRNVLLVWGCGTVLGKHGNDALRARPDQRCATPMTLDGGNGDDVLRGSSFGDRLLGGAGADIADGGPGRDLCRAEQVRACED